ncbi:hypothetical protein AVEN_99778-1, partial [Araneus ventricosus]
MPKYALITAQTRILERHSSLIKYLQWKKDGKVVEIDGKNVKTSIESDDSVTLIIVKLKKEDVGKYTCEITNPHGSDATSGNVTVT